MHESNGPEMDEFGELIERLRDELSDDMATGASVGAENGERFAMDLSHDALKHLANDGLPPGYDSVLDLIEREYGQAAGPDWRSSLYKVHSVGNRQAFDEGFTKGFVAAICGIWTQIESRL